MNDTVSGKAAIDLAFVAYENGRRTALSEPQRLRVQAGRGVAVDVTVYGEITARILRQTARLLVANAEVLEDVEGSAEGVAPVIDGEGSREGLNPSTHSPADQNL